MSQYDTEKFCQPPDPDLICCICQCVLLSPVESPCRHVFCNICITTWLSNHRNCPTCRSRVKKRQLKPVLPMVQNMINRLLMLCDFRGNGCTENIMLELYLGHVESCGYRKVKCRFTRCDKTILVKDKDQHENKDCEFREKLCTRRCGLMIPVCMYDNHDCYEELRQFNKEKSEMVDKLQEKVKELNELTQKLQKEVHRLQQQLARRRWSLPDIWGSSWDPSDDDYSDSMYNYLSGSSDTNDDSNETDSQDLTLTRSGQPSTVTTTTTSSATSGGFREYVIYPSHRPTTPVIQTPWPRYETRSRRFVYEIRSPSPVNNANNTNATEQVLDLSQSSQQNRIIPLYSPTEVNGLVTTTETSLQDQTNNTTYSHENQIDVHQENISLNTRGSVTNGNGGRDSEISNIENNPDVTHHSDEETSHHGDHSVYSLSNSDSDRSPSRWWRSSRSSLSHQSENHTDNRQRSSRPRSYDSNRSRSRSYNSYRSRSRSFDSQRSDYWSDYHSGRSRSRSAFSNRSRSYSYDYYRRSRSYNSFRSRSRSNGSYRSRARSNESYRSGSRSYDYARSLSQSPSLRRGWSSTSSLMSRSSYGMSDLSRRSRSRSRSIRSSRSRSSSSLNSRSGSRSFLSDMSRSHSSENSYASGTTIRSYRSRSHSSRSKTPDSEQSRTPVSGQLAVISSGELTTKALESNSRTDHVSDSKSMAGHNVFGPESHPDDTVNEAVGVSSTVDGTETDSEAEYNFKRKKSMVENNCVDSGIGTESSSGSLDPTSHHIQSGTESSPGSLVPTPHHSQSDSHFDNNYRKRKHSATHQDRNTKRSCSGEGLSNTDNSSDSDTSWIPSPGDHETDDTISQEGTSGSSYEVEVPKTIMEYIDEYDSCETDDTWSPNLT